MDSDNFALYQSGRPFHYFGGYAKTSPFLLKAPRSGRWHVVVDLGGYAGQVRAGVKVLETARSRPKTMRRGFRLNPLFATLLLARSKST